MRLIAASVTAVALMATAGHAQEAGLLPSLERLAKTDNPEAIYHLGMAYHTGSGAAKDLNKALAAFRKAAALGDPLASYKIGCYYDGQGAGLVSFDEEKALEYKLVAAKAGYALAEQDVGILYARRGNMAEGLAWLEKSASQGWTESLLTLASVYNGTSGITPDPAKTAAYFRLFLSRSEPDAQQEAWLSRFEQQLSPGDKKRAEEIVRRYRPTPTLLTLKGLSGQRAAQALIQTSISS
ncbi:hypothetical protein LQ954_01065 [Sphingomonas sp. IC-11]|uniref:tetratricopeptide repeat protein n=1 Tax=Sphingomonas sp. IC-11 TaxID=2898528 RepID=UPI001E5125DF|nr:hypothetical protein [Sphingomonas sp. IC-11]MCD2314732.1 hypothetical protein [Sphingomonas sp. IC-11]